LAGGNISPAKAQEPALIGVQGGPGAGGVARGAKIAI
jgi:hypothetical protein